MSATYIKGVSDNFGNAQVNQRQANQGHIVAIEQRGKVLLLGRAQFLIGVQK
ncbi:hypothetical protein [Prosthecobacter sp.]